MWICLRVSMPRRNLQTFEFPLTLSVTQDYRNVAKTKFVTLSSCLD